MKKMKKVLALAACAVLLVTASVMGTLAYLTSQATVTNTFTVGNVKITMVESKVDEYGEKLTGDKAGTTDNNEYKLIPGHVYTKDPTITVDDASEDCYLFVKIENGLGNDGVILYNKENETSITDDSVTTWELVEGTKDVYAYQKVVSANEKVVAFEAFKFNSDADPTDHVNAGATDAEDDDVKHKITVTAYAIQSDGIDTTSWSDKTRWEALKEQLDD